MKLKMERLSFREVAEHLKLGESIVRGYFSEVRSNFKTRTGVSVSSDEALVQYYREFLERNSSRAKKSSVR